MQPLRRVAELLHRRAEWWLFKVVWTLSTTVLVLLVGVAASYAVRSALLGLFRLQAILRCGSDGRHKGPAGDRLEALEALVLVVCPGVLILALCRLAGDTSGGLPAVLFCLSMGEMAALCFLRSQESRYLFPRVVLPVYAADMYYAFFHPFGFTLLAHSTLFCFQGFILCTLWSHFEATVQLPQTCPDHLAVEVRLRPSERRPRVPPALTPQTQRLLLEQGLLLLGDDRSYESGVVMSAIVTRSLQVTQVPPPPRPPPSAPQPLVFGALPQAVVELLGGGPGAQALVSRAHAGDTRCMALLGHVLSRLPPPPAQQAQTQLLPRGPFARAQGPGLPDTAAAAAPAAGTTAVGGSAAAPAPAAAGTAPQQLRQRTAPRRPAAGAVLRQLGSGAPEPCEPPGAAHASGSARGAGASGVGGSAPSRGAREPGGGTAVTGV